MRNQTLLSVTVTMALLVAACDSGTAESAEPAAASPTAAVYQATTTTAAASSPTTGTGADVMVYVAMGDSLSNSPDKPQGVMWQYAQKLEEHFGREVDLRNRVIGSIHSSTMLEQLQSNESLRADLVEADVVTTDIPIAWFVDPLKTVGGWQGADPAACGGDDGEQCLRDALDNYKADTDAIIDEIVAICDDDVLIRLLDLYMINTGYKLETGTLDISNPYWKAAMDYVEESAARYGIPVAQVYDEFMGPKGTDDPYLKGILDEDQLHPNADGAALIADLLDDLGYGD